MLKHDVNSSSDELSALGSKRPSKAKRVLSVIGESLLLIVFTLVLSVSGQITYDYTRYSTFFVNGMSMYPTLNADAYAIGDDGTFHRGDSASDTMGLLYSWRNFTNSSVTYYCDYGMFDGKGDYLSKLKRFDVVVTYFPDDLELKDGHYVPKSASDTGSAPDLKIKRLIALPNETFRFDSQGDLWVKKVGSATFELQEQSFLDSAVKTIDPDWKKQTVISNSGSAYNTAWTSDNGLTLGEGQYFVCGDNRLRSNSTDSRIVGAIPADAIQGRAVTIIGRCSFKYYSSTKQDFHALWNSYKMPWQLEWL